MSLFPLPALIFLSCLLVLLIVLGILYYLLQKKQLCPVEGGTDEEQPLLEGEEAPAPETAADTTDAAAAPADTGNTEAGAGGESAPAEDTLPDPAADELPLDELVPETGGYADEPLPPTTPMTMAPPPPDPGATPTPSQGSATAAPENPVEEPEPEEPLCMAGKPDEEFPGPSAATAKKRAAEDAESVASYEEIGFMPELLVNLHYQDLTGRLVVEVIKASNLKSKNMFLNPTTLVKIKCVAGDGKKIGKSTTGIHFACADPEYNETFVYPMSPVDLKLATMMFSMIAVGKRNKHSVLGWFSMGQNTSGPSETAHWKEMVANPDCDIVHWQILKQP